MQTTFQQLRIVSIAVVFVFISLFLILGTTPVYADSVDTLWLRLYEGPTDKQDVIKDVSVDASGNTYVTGRSQGIWPAQAFSDLDIVTIKYMPNGDTAWVRRYDPQDTLQEEGLLLGLSPNGHLYVAGHSYRPATFFNAILIRYNTSGDTIWTRIINGGILKDIDVTDNGTVCVTMTISDGSQNDWFTACYDSGGGLIWSDQVGTAGQQDEPAAIDFDTSNNLYVAGYLSSVSTGSDMHIIKYSPTGSISWSNTFNGAANLSDSPSDITVDNNQESIVVWTSSLTVTNAEVRTRKYSSSGSELWTRTFHAPGSGIDLSEKVGVDSADNVFMSGSFWITGSVSNLGIVKYSSNGDSLLSKYFSKIKHVTDMVVDNGGNVYVTADGLVSAFFSDWGTVKFTPSLDTAWFRWLLNGTFPSGNQFPSAIAVANDGDVIVGGYISDGSLSNPHDYATVRYTDTSGCCIGNRGDLNSDGTDANILDLTFAVDRIFRGGPPPLCSEEGDVNSDSASTNILDLTYLVDRIFRGGPPPGTC